jgi:hypothetical protein
MSDEDLIASIAKGVGLLIVGLILLHIAAH